MAEVYKPVNGTTQLPTTLSANGNLTVEVNIPAIAYQTSATGYPTTDNYLSIWTGPRPVNKSGSNTLIDLFETGGQNIKYKITAGPTAALQHEIKGETVLSANDDVVETVSSAYLYVDVLAKSSVAGTPGTVKGYLIRG
jgi:hypothetical protein